MIYRVVQESITNAIRHGKAKQIDVNLWKEDKWLNLEIKEMETDVKRFIQDLD